MAADYVTGKPLAASRSPLTPPWLQRRSAQWLFESGFGLTATISIALVALILVFLAVYAWPAIRFNGTNVLSGATWNMGNQYGGTLAHANGETAQSGASFGGLVFIFGTLATSALAMLIAVPFSLLVSLALAYKVPKRGLPFVSAVVELMAGVPSVVYGLWGIIVLVPWINRTFAPEAGSGNGLLAAGLILSMMVTPIMVATMRDVILAQSPAIFEASMALGSTSWYAVTKAVLPSVRTGLVASGLIALGRALGETMAVLMVSGSALNTFPQNIFQPVNTIAAVIVSQLDSALTDSTGMAQRSLAELAVLLFIITLGVNIIARLVLRGADRGTTR